MLKRQKKRGTGLRTGVFFWFFSFAALMLAILWLAQGLFLDRFYLFAMQRRMTEVSHDVFAIYEDYESKGREEEGASNGITTESASGTNDAEGSSGGNTPTLRSEIEALSLNSQMSVTVYRVDTVEENLYFYPAVSATTAGSAANDITAAEYRDLLRLLYADAIEQNNEVFWYYRPSDETQIESLSSRLLHAEIFLSNGEEYLILLDCVRTPVDGTVYVLRYQLFGFTGIILLAATLLSLFVSGRLSRPLVRINRAAKALPSGRYESPITGGYREIRELSDTLSTAADELSRTDRYEKELIANMSHDLRTPLTMIMGYGEVMRDFESERTPENVQVVIDEARRLSGIVDDLLTLSRLQSGDTLNEKREMFDLSLAIEETVERYRRMKEASGFSFTYETSGAAHVSADRTHILRVLSNLINNAVNYSANDRRVEISCMTDGARVTVTVTDHGVGIDKDALPHIFERYYKVDKTHNRARVGSGIGLSIVKRILAEYGTECCVESRLGVGSSFSFSLPTVAAGEDTVDLKSNRKNIE